MRHIIAFVKYWVLEGLSLFLTLPEDRKKPTVEPQLIYGPDEARSLNVAVADKGVKLGQCKEYSAYIFDYMFHKASFYNNVESFYIFVRRLGLTLLPANYLYGPGASFYCLKEKIVNTSFSRREQVPADAHPIMGHSNGSLVRCYWKRFGDTICVYRPNPNFKRVYRPLTLKLHITYKFNNGGF